MTTDPDMTFTPETEFGIKNIGYGLVSWEAGSNFLEYRDGRMFTSTFDRGDGLMWDGRNWRTDGSLGLTCVIVRKTDMTPAQIAEAFEQSDA